MDTPKKVSDQQLVSDYINGRELALNELLKRHQHKLINFINFIVKDSDLANDIFQESFFKFIKASKNASFKNDGKFYGYLSTIAYNLAMDHIRKNKKMPTISGGVDWCIFSNLKVHETNALNKMINNQSKIILRKVLDELPNKYKEIIEMRLLRNMSFKEIAAHTNTPINTCLSHFRNAIIKIKQLMAQKNVTEEVLALAS
jgi:RNA polymerase sigma-70 factor (ECF subfamily)